MDWLWSLFERGGPTMYAIASVALLGLTIYIDRLLALRGLVPAVHDLTRRVRDAADDLPKVLAHCTDAQHSLTPMLGRGVEAAMRGAPRDEVLANMSREGRRLTMRMKRGLGALAMLGTMAPFLGLLGTVLGIMQALRDLGAATVTGQGAGYSVVARGVAEALVTTAAGIVVAVILVLLHQHLRARLSVAVLEIQLLAEETADLFAKTSAPQDTVDPI